MEIDQKFRVSAALKDIIGQELITDDFIAVFELVKNSFDANASRVDIIFDGLTTNNPKLIIMDNGIGMDRVDLEEKWLFVAYSAKKEGTGDYRDKIQSNRIQAGAKGIGRFSCDRLGKHLTIYTTKEKKPSIFHKLEVDWVDFEKDMHQDFIKIPVKYSATNTAPYEQGKGVLLEITSLREVWGREKLLRLKRSLEKLINPNQENDSKNFSIYLTVPDEKIADNDVKKKEPWNVVNGRIENKIFEDLGLKTTKIYSTISKDGKTITTRLEDRGKLIYEIVEKNPYKVGKKNLEDIGIHLYAMNRAAKLIFFSRMGIRVVEYGSVFLYKNGFRIHPVGDVRGGDLFALDRRKAQHYSTYLGTRELLGRIEINGANPAFKETTSRDGGLIKNQHFELLQKFFFECALKRLEKFAIDVIKYGSEELSELFSYKDINRSEVFDLIKNLANSDEIMQFYYDPKILDILSEVSEQSLKSILENFSRLAAKTGNKQLEAEAKKAERRLQELQKAKEAAEREAERREKERQEAEKKARAEAERAKEAEKRADDAEKDAEQKTSQNLFLKSMVSQDITNVVSLHHHIGIAAGAIENYIKTITRRIKNGKPITADDFLAVLDDISYQAKKISSTARFATKANFMLDSAIIKGDLCNFIGEYILNICSGLIKTEDYKRDILFKWNCSTKGVFLTNYRPLEITIVLDNLISNARKARAETIDVYARVINNTLELILNDDGVGIKKDSEKRIFELGYTTTNGSGLGLHQVAELLEAMGGSIELVKGSLKGAAFKLKIPEA